MFSWRCFCQLRKNFKPIKKCFKSATKTGNIIFNSVGKTKKRPLFIFIACKMGNPIMFSSSTSTKRASIRFHNCNFAIYTENPLFLRSRGKSGWWKIAPAVINISSNKGKCSFGVYNCKTDLLETRLC